MLQVTDLLYMRKKREEDGKYEVKGVVIMDIERLFITKPLPFCPRCGNSLFHTIDKDYHENFFRTSKCIAAFYDIPDCHFSFTENITSEVEKVIIWLREFVNERF